MGANRISIFPTSVTFTALNWDIPQTVTATGVNDNVDDGDIVYNIVTASATSTDALYGVINPTDVAITNTDDDTAGITVNPTAGLVTTESGGISAFTIVLNSEPIANVSIGVTSSDATEATVAPASVTFTALNWNLPQTVTATGVDDTLLDGNIAYSLVTAQAASADGLYSVINPSDVSATNTDNDVPGVTVNPTFGLVTTESGGTDSFTVVLNVQPAANVSIGLSSSDTGEGTVTPASVTFTAANWNLPQTVTVTGVDDVLLDGAQPYTIITAASSSADAAYAGINPADVSADNQDNDQVSAPAGTAWNLNNLTSNGLSQISWNGSQFLTVGDLGTILTSPDGVNWTPQTSGVTSGLSAVNWNGSQYLTVGLGGVILTSPEGATWTAQTSGTTADFTSVNWNGSQYVAVGLGGIVCTSPDGITWTVQTSGTASGLNNVTWNGSQYVAVGLGGIVCTSPDGITWTVQTSGTASGLNNVAWNGTQYLAVGDAGTVLTSADGINWVSQTSGTTNALSAINWNGSQYLAVSPGGTILTSTDGINWVIQSIAGGNFLGVVWNGSQYVVVGAAGNILASTINPVSTHIIGGSVSGLTSSVTLQNNGGDAIAIAANGGFIFPTALAEGAIYAVTVSAQPAGQTCVVTSGSGTVSTANVTGVAVICTTDPLPTHTIGGSVTGLTGSMTLQNNGGDALVVSANGSFTFATAIIEGNAYAVTVSSQPAGQTCVVTSGSGTVATATVSSVSVACAVAGIPLSIAAGDTHTCAVRANGTLWCWGDNSFGALGDGTVVDSATPVQEATLATNWVSVSGSCAVKSNGTIWCWGNSNIVTGPVQENSLATDWVSVMVGNGQTCGLKTNSTLWCGVGGFNLPVQETTLATDWAEVNTADFHSCAVKTDGTLWCWGDNTEGQLGNGNNTSSNFPVQEATLATDWASVSTGNVGYTCATKANGTLWCWGYNWDGQLGNGNNTNSTTPVQEAGLSTNWATVSAGEEHSCALQQDGTLWCWGFGGSGVLGNGALTSSNVPVQEVGLATDWSSVSAGLGYTCTVKTDGTIQCWGADGPGLLGDGSPADSRTPVQEATLATDWATLAAGDSHGCGVKIDGTLWCWGGNWEGQLGNGNTAGPQTPVQEVSAATNWTTVSAGTEHSCAVKADGTLWCWGANWGGILGNGTMAGPSANGAAIGGSATPLQEAGLASNWAMVSAALDFTYALKTDGTVWRWGNATTSPAQLPALGTSGAVVSGGADGHVCVLKTDGSIWCWGDNFFGQLGNGNTIASSVPVQEATLATDWAGISAGGGHTCASKANGTLWCWGDNFFGQLGNGNNTMSSRSSSSPVQEVSAATNWTAVSAGDEHTCAVKADGSIWCWGANNGDLGNGSKIHSNTPIQEATLATNWTSVIAAATFTCGLKNNGTTWCWGTNGSGELGGNDASQITPSPVLFP